MFWDQKLEFLAINMLPVLADGDIPPGVLVKAGELPWLKTDRVYSNCIRDAELVALWRAERRKLEEAGVLTPLPET